MSEPGPGRVAVGHDDAAASTASGGAGSAVAEKLAAIRARIEAAGGDPAKVALVAVTKGFGAAVARAALDAGIDDLGENYGQELLEKAAALGEPGASAGDRRPRWHFLGPVQRNKVAALAPRVTCWQGVDRVAAGEEIARRRPGARVLVQVNSTGEASKHGCRPEDTAELVEHLRRLPLDVAGLMTIGPTGPPESARPAFRLVAELARRLGLSEVSMGMTDDFEVAVREGSTMVRIGRGLFGSRERLAKPATVGS